MQPNEIFNDENYLKLLDLAYEVAQALKGKEITDGRLPDCQQLAAKLYFHASTLYYLGQGTKTPVPLSTNGSSFFDFASTAVLTRAVLETYLTLYEVFFASVSEDEREFRYRVWQLSGFVIREHFVPSDPEGQKTHADAQNDIQELREQIQRTKTFEALPAGEKRRILKGGRLNKEFNSRLTEAGLRSGWFLQIYKFFSGYSHSDGLAGAQIVNATTKEEQREHMEMHKGITMMILAKMITEYIRIFPESKTAADARPQAHGLANLLSHLANQAV